MIKEGSINNKVALKKQITPESLDFDIEDIYNISKEDMMKFTKGLLKK